MPITDDDDAIRNKTSIGGRAIKTIQQQNDIGVVRAPKGEQNSSVEKGRPTTNQSLKFFGSCKMSSAASCD